MADPFVTPETGTSSPPSVREVRRQKKAERRRSEETGVRTIPALEIKSPSSNQEEPEREKEDTSKIAAPSSPKAASGPDVLSGRMPWWHLTYPWWTVMEGDYAELADDRTFTVVERFAKWIFFTDIAFEGPPTAMASKWSEFKANEAENLRATEELMKTSDVGKMMAVHRYCGQHGYPCAVKAAMDITSCQFCFKGDECFGDAGQYAEYDDLVSAIVQIIN